MIPDPTTVALAITTTDAYNTHAPDSWDHDTPHGLMAWLLDQGVINRDALAAKLHDLRS